MNRPSLNVKLIILLFIAVSFASHAQNMFYHLLPGFVPPYTWVGLGGDANWDTAANWSTSAIPGASNVAIFDSNCVTNCNAVINVPISVAGIDVKGTFIGSLSQGTSNTIAIGSSGWSQAAGTFNGGTGDITLTNSNLTLSNSAVFNSTSGELYFNAAHGTSTILSVPASAAINFPDNSTARFRLQGACGSPYYTISSPQKISFYNLRTESHSVGCGSAYLGNAAGTFEIRNDYTHPSTDPLIVQGSYELYGNASATAQAAEGTWYIKGASSKTYTGGGGLGSLVIQKTGGATFTPVNSTQTFYLSKLDVQTGGFEFPQSLYMVWTGNGGDYFKIASGTSITVPSNSLVNIRVDGGCGGPTKSFDVNSSFNFENLNMWGYATGCGAATVTLAAGDSLTAKKTFTMGGSFIANFDIAVEGTLHQTAAQGGNMAITLSGSTSSSVSLSSATTPSGLFTINKPSAIATATSNITLNTATQDLTITNGTLNMAGYNLLVNDILTIGSSGKLVCGGGSATAGSWVISGEISCGSGQGITWTGAAGDGLWSTAGNWTNNNVPGASDIAVFSGTCSGANCNARINSNLSVRGIVMTSAYGGTISQDTTRTLTVGTSGFTQNGGTFAGGDAAITMSGALNVASGTFTATSGTWTQNANLTLASGATFNHNNGTLTSSIGMTLSPNGKSFNNVTFAGSQQIFSLNNQTMIVLGTLSLADINVSGTNNQINSGTIEARGDVNIVTAGKTGSAVVVINGTGSQMLSGVATAYAPEIQINKAAGSLTMSGTILTTKNWSHLAGSVSTSGTTLAFSGVSTSQTITPGTMTYNNVTFGGNFVSHSLNNGTMTVTGTLTLADVNGSLGTIMSGTIEAQGDVTVASVGKKVTGLILINGTGTQTLTGAAGGYIGNLQINKPSGTLNLASTIRSLGSWTWTAGTVSAGSSTVQFDAVTGSVTNQIIPGPVLYNNVTFGGNVTSENLNGGTLIVTGTLTFSDVNATPGTLSNGTIEARGDINIVNQGKYITGLLLINGTGNQTFTGVSTGRVGHTEINKASNTLTLANTIRFAGNLNYVAGTVDAGSSTVQFDTTNTITPGSVVFNNVTFSGNTVSNNLNSGTLIVNGTLTLTDSSGTPGSITSGTLEARGNVVAANVGRTGNATLNYTGTSSTTLSSAVNASMLTTTHVVLKTGGGQVALGGNMSFSSAGRSFTVSSGTLSLAGYDLSVNNTLTVGAGATLKCAGGTYTVGTLSNSGTVNCPGFSGYDFNWTGGAGDSNWSTAANWQGNVAPSSADVVVFQDTYCGGACSATMSSAVNVRGVRLNSPYTGTLTQAAGNTLIVGSRGWTQAAGTFSGGTSAITMNGPFSLTGGTFTATSGSLGVYANWVVTGGTFNHNNGRFMLGNTSTITLTPGTNSYYDLAIPAVGACTGWTMSGNLDVANSISASGDAWCGPVPTFSGGTVRLSGPTMTFGNRGVGGTAVFHLLGNASGQTLSGASSITYIPSLVINAGANDVTLLGSPTFTGNYTVQSVGTLSAASASVLFLGPSGTTITPGSATYGNVTFYGVGTCATYTLGGNTMEVGGLLTLNADTWCSSYRPINNGTINVSGSMTVLNNGLNGTAAINFTGSTDATLTMAASGYMPSGNSTINKTSGSKLTLAANARFNVLATHNLTVTAGTLDMAGYNLAVGNNISNSGTIRRGANPSCGTITQGGTYSGNAAICP